MNIDWKRKLGSRKFWACVAAVIVSLVAFTNATPETTERIVALLGAIGGLCMYMLSEGLADSGPTNINVEAKEFVDEENM